MASLCYLAVVVHWMSFFEMLTLGQLGYHAKPCGILKISGYYDYLLKFLDHAVTQDFFHLLIAR